MGEKLNSSMKSDKVLLRLHRSNESLASSNLNLSSQIFELHSLIDGNPRAPRVTSLKPKFVRAASDEAYRFRRSVTSASLKKVSEHGQQLSRTPVLTSWEVVERKISTVSSAGGFFSGFSFSNSFYGNKLFIVSLTLFFYILL